MKRFFLIVLGGLMGFTAWADSGSEAVLEKLRGKINSYGSYRIHLTAAMESEEAAKGTITISGLKFAAKMMGQELYYDGVTLWNHIPAEKEVTIEQLNAQQGSVLANPAKLLNVDPNDYNHRSLPTIRGEGTGKELQVVELIPKASVTDYASLILYVDPVTSLPTRITINSPVTEKPIELIITKLENDFPVTMKDFQFDTDKHREVEVIDFR